MTNRIQVPCHQGPHHHAYDTREGCIVMLNLAGQTHKFFLGSQYDGSITLMDYRTGLNMPGSTDLAKLDAPTPQELVDRLVAKHGVAKILTKMSEYPTLNM